MNAGDWNEDLDKTLPCDRISRIYSGPLVQVRALKLVPSKGRKMEGHWDGAFLVLSMEKTAAGRSNEVWSPCALLGKETPTASVSFQKITAATFLNVTQNDPFRGHLNAGLCGAGYFPLPIANIHACGGKVCGLIEIHLSRGEAHEGSCKRSAV